MSGFDVLYLAGLAVMTGYLLVARVPSVLHTTLLAGTSLVHGIVLIGAIVVISEAEGLLPTLLGALAVALGTANLVGGFVVTDRLLSVFEQSKRRRRARVPDRSDAEKGS